MVNLPPSRLVNRKVVYKARVPVGGGNTYKRIQSIGIADVFRCSLPAQGVWTDYQITEIALGQGDGATSDFIPHRYN